MAKKSDDQRKAMFANMANPRSRPKSKRLKRPKSTKHKSLKPISSSPIDMIIVERKSTGVYKLPATEYYKQRELKKEINLMRAKLYGTGDPIHDRYKVYPLYATLLDQHKEDITKHKKGSIKYKYHKWRIKLLQKDVDYLVREIQDKQKMIDLIDKKIVFQYRS